MKKYINILTERYGSPVKTATAIGVSRRQYQNVRSELEHEREKVGENILIRIVLLALYPRIFRTVLDIIKRERIS